MRLELSNNPNLLLFTSNLFPATFNAIGLKHYAIIGIGGNVGESVLLFERVIRYLQQGKRVNVIQTAPLLKNPPFGFTDQPDFINSVIKIETNLSPFQLLKYLLWVEKRFGRKRTFKNAPRTLDLDIIFYDKLNLRTKRLIVPHPHFHERESVMIPLRFLKD
ncbi:2-amino-4-hydroxy-6-hydroxymethyldihydropteridine diphosphokinase [Hydrogenimonas thermophila]|uniref:2-amino-4-hydroxy-6- hydroxymethyldihydropteridine diphosphokinase n=1 Tax=Hydrogenimonas thermophila TaxID=223786 RepID=UPI00293737FB|nr:2-amino-4-hydroxy-6-hydroxymethyldihydropteridine diphosphokinase [Hydrogenimonas thermophila]WOE70438.1 2-amino-4-hydroxy-6-hydroxymethyldihydropteridine diphosphokinase [Hydrogenimonas thermophila]WOE72955.1 2-amino-4-hydroxy-6-hydroxymethyldihydropteridine diphosphokinase [Hydrogenimonas thermophila]